MRSAYLLSTIQVEMNVIRRMLYSNRTLVRFSNFDIYCNSMKNKIDKPVLPDKVEIANKRGSHCNVIYLCNKSLTL